MHLALSVLSSHGAKGEAQPAMDTGTRGYSFTAEAQVYLHCELHNCRATLASWTNSRACLKISNSFKSKNLLLLLGTKHSLCRSPGTRNYPEVKSFWGAGQVVGI